MKKKIIYFNLMFSWFYFFEVVIETSLFTLMSRVEKLSCETKLCIYVAQFSQLCLS